MQAHSASERSVRYLFLMRARVANHYPTHPFRTVSPRTGVKIKRVAQSGCNRIEGDFVAQSFQAPHKTTLDGLAIPRLSK